jgi:DNA repair exonuclease SbcCD nuclease subunit
MRILIWSDIQFNLWQEFSRILPNGLNSRFWDQLTAQEEIFDYSIANGTDIMVHTGDLFESRTDKIDKAMYMTVFERFAEFAKKSSAVVVLLVGNHDWIDKTETKHILEPFKKIENVIVADKPTYETMKIGMNSAATLAFIPYTSTGFRHKVNNIADKVMKGTKPAYLFTHQGVTDAVTGPRDTPLQDEYALKDFRPEVFNIIFNGHYHKPQTLGMYSSRYRGFMQIVGSSLQKDFGEREDEKRFCFLDTEDPTGIPFSIKTTGPKFYKMEVHKQEDLLVPKGFSNYDYLWVMSYGPDYGSIEDELDRQGVNLGNVRIEVEKVDIKGVRTEISLTQPVELQMVHAIDYLLYKMGKDLDKDRVLKMAMDKYQKSLE